MPDSTSALINQLMNPPSPFAGAGQAIEGMNRLQQYKADAAAAEAYRQSIDPATGQFDQAKFNAIASQTPGGSWNFGRQMQSAGQGLQAQSAGTSSQLDAQRAKIEGVAGQLYPLMQTVLSGGTVTGADLQAKVDQAKALGLTTPDMLANMQKHIDKIGPDGNANSIVQGAMYGTLTAAERYRAVIGQPTGVNTGEAYKFVQPQPGAVQPATGAVPLGLSPGEKANISFKLTDPHPFTGNDGTPYPNASHADWLKYHGQDPYTVVTEPAGVGAPAPGGAPAPAPAAPRGTGGGPASSVTTGRASAVPPPPARQRAAQPPASQKPAEPAAGFDPATLEVGRKAYASDLEMAGTLPNRIGPMQQAISILRTHKDLQTVGQDELNQVQAVLHAFGVPVSNINNVNAFQELSKALAQNAQSTPGANRSDMAQTATQAATPHIGQSRDAIVKLLAKSIGVERLRGAGIDYFHQQHGSQEEAAKNSGQYQIKVRPWLSKQDSNAYALDQLIDDEIKQYYEGLSAEDKKRLAASAREAVKLKSPK